MSEVPLIELRGLSKIYGKGDAAFHALRGVDLTIQAGEFVAIMGPSGSGKSTLMNLLGCLDTPTSGSYRFQGISVETLGKDQRSLLRRHALGFIFQGFNLLARTSALENVELPLLYRGYSGRERHQMARAALASVGLPDKERNTPAELSGGQQQRVAIARALAMKPKVILFDEPTSALDPELVGEVLDVMRALASDGMTMMVVTHEMSFAREVCHRIAFMEEGRVVECSTPAEVLDNPAFERTRAFLSTVQ